MGRNTRQLGAIKRAFVQAGRPLTPAEVLMEARRVVGSIGLATVYRNIRALGEEGWLATVEIPGEAPRHELAGLDHHHHFRCRQCRLVFDIPCPVDGPALAVPDGFSLEEHDLVLHGTCPDCRR